MADNDGDLSPANIANWLCAIESYLMVTEETSLKLGLKVGSEEIKSVLQLLPNSPIKELNVEGSNLNGKIGDLSEFLMQTQVTTLTLKECQLSVSDFVHLVKILKGTRITDLSVSSNEIKLDESTTDDIIPHLCESRLTALNFENNAVPHDKSVLFAEALISTSMTHLNLSHVFRGYESRSAILTLFPGLKHSAIKVLDLSFNEIKSADLKDLGESLRNSKLEELDLSFNQIKDAGVDFLFEALERSKVVDLSLRYTEISGCNSLGLRIKNTQVKILDLSCNTINEIEMFAFPDFLRGSAVESLDLDNCTLGDEIAEQIIPSLKFSRVTSLNLASNYLRSPSIYKLRELLVCGNIASIDISDNKFDYNAIIALGDCLKASKLKKIEMSHFGTRYWGDISLALAEFSEKTNGTSLVSVGMNWNMVQPVPCKNIASSLVNTTFTHFDFRSNKLKKGVKNLATYLKFTLITHLNLNDNQIGDAGAKALAKCLKETQIVELDIGCNSITSVGAKALAHVFKNSKVLRLILSRNQIENAGLEVLAEQARHSFITVLDVEQNPGNRAMLIDSVLWENRASAQRLLATLKKITSESDDTNLHFDRNTDGIDINAFLEDCLFVYETITQQPPAMNSLLEDSKISFSRDQLTRLVLEKFPQQFSDFIGRRICADITEHVNFLKRVENLRLSRVVECLLFNRPLYTIDEDQGVLHPYVYPLLLKYKHPICSAVEPQAKDKLVQYFSENIQVEGASEVVHLLRDLKI